MSYCWYPNWQADGEHGVECRFRTIGTAALDIHGYAAMMALPMERRPGPLDFLACNRHRRDLDEWLGTKLDPSDDGVADIIIVDRPLSIEEVRTVAEALTGAIRPEKHDLLKTLDSEAPNTT